jgi:hypothetical protein
MFAIFKTLRREKRLAAAHKAHESAAECVHRIIQFFDSQQTTARIKNHRC